MIGSGVHIRAQDRVDPRLVAALAAEPFEKIRVQPHRHGFFPPRHDYACVLPEALVGSLCVGIFDDRGMYLLVSHRAKPPPVSLGISLRGGSSSIVVHEAPTPMLI